MKHGRKIISYILMTIKSRSNDAKHIREATPKSTYL